MLRRDPSRKVIFKRKKRRVLPALALAILLAGGAAGAYALFREDSPEAERHARLVAPQDECAIDPAILQRVLNGYVPGRSGDVLAVEQVPNQFNTRHSTPWPYTQEVPLVLYGPGFIKKGVTVERGVTVADIAPTFADLLHFDGWPKEREGEPLREALLPENERNGTPKLIFTLVWDGGGDNALDYWPDRWPNLAKLMGNGTNFTEATVGSSPSITPAIHATIGTGVFPSTHGLSDTRIRVKGEMLDAWEKTSPRFLRVKTLADLYDAAMGNAPLVGMLARDSWHLGMIGHGAYLPEGDHDIAVMDQLGGIEFRTNPDYYSMPEYMKGTEGLTEAVDEMDARDGKKDGLWLGNTVLPYDGLVRFTPAWSIYQTKRIDQLLENEGFGTDDVPDLFYTNYKAIDLAGHHWNMIEPEMGENIEAADDQIPLLLRELNKTVGKGNYVIAMTADHGMTPLPTYTKGWSIELQDMTEDIEKKFDKVTPNIPLIRSNRGYQIMLNHNELKRNDITAEDVAAFVADYRIADNVTPTNKVLPRFEGRTDERLFLTAMTPDQMREALDCNQSPSALAPVRTRARTRAFATRQRKSGLPRR